MEFTHLFVLALFFLTIVGINGSKSGEEYWKSVWPNTPMPNILSDLLLPESGTSVPINGQDEKQYWTVFFEHDLYPGKKMSLGAHKHSDVQPSQSKGHLPVKKPNQFFGTRKWLEKTSAKASQPFGINIWWEQKESEKPKIPFGTHISADKPTEEEMAKPNDNFGILIWTGKVSRSFQTRTSTEDEMDKPNDNIGIILWTGKVSQSIRTRISIDNAAKKETEKISQTSVAHKLDEKETHILHSYCGNPSAIGEVKHCAHSLESMMDFAISKLGKNIKVMSSSFAQSHDQYAVEEVRKIGDNAVMCHRMNLKKVGFYCHQINATTTYMVPLVASDGTKSKALTICHHDTRGMDPNMLYEVLKVKPGTVPVCHFIGNKAIAWVPNDVVSESDDHPCAI